AGCWEPYESRDSRTVLGARGGESPPRDSTICLRRGSPAQGPGRVRRVLQPMAPASLDKPASPLRTGSDNAGLPERHCGGDASAGRAASHLPDSCMTEPISILRPTPRQCDIIEARPSDFTIPAFVLRGGRHMALRRIAILAILILGSNMARTRADSADGIAY